jgi:hypothetical protein
VRPPCLPACPCGPRRGLWGTGSFACLAAGRRAWARKASQPLPPTTIPPLPRHAARRRGGTRARARSARRTRSCLISLARPSRVVALDRSPLRPRLRFPISATNSLLLHTHRIMHANHLPRHSTRKAPVLVSSSLPLAHGTADASGPHGSHTTMVRWKM